MPRKKIHPCRRWTNGSRKPADDEHQQSEDVSNTSCCCCSESASALTVWKKSSMSFQGTDGFTVFDDSGRLCFRVENYTRNKQRNFGINGRSGVLVLVDGLGQPLLTLVPQIFSLQQQWNVYRETDSQQRRGPGSFVFSMKKKSIYPQRGSYIEAEMVMGRVEGSSPVRKSPDFRIEGSFRRRSCQIKRLPDGEVIAKIARKKVINSTFLLSDEVFSLVVIPGFSSELVMAFVVILDRICGNKFVSRMCSST